MADTSGTSGIDSAGIMALLSQLGLSQYINGGSNNGQQTVAGQPAQYDQGTVNLSNAGSQGGYTDQMLQGNAMPTGYARSGQQVQSGYGMTSTVNNGQGAYYPTSDKAASNFLNAQNTFNQNQATSIQNLLNQLSGSGSSAAATPPPNLATGLSSASPNQGSTVLSGGGGFTAPSAAQIPGLAEAQAAGQQQQLPGMGGAPAQQQALPSAPVTTMNATPILRPDPTGQTTVPANNPAAVTQMVNQQGGPLQASSGSGIQPGSLNRSSPVVIPPNQGAAVPPFTPTGMPQNSLPSAPTTNVGTTIGNGVTQIGKAFQTYQQNQQGVQSGVSLRNYSPSSTGDPDPD